ncbi:MAG: hypothetical protein Q4G33_05770 [bacterium]|nr:hypothetical protein [bacterium]
MKKIFTAMITTAGITVMSVCAAEATGQVLSTDIGTVIDGAACRTYNVDGRTFVVAEELRAYGFDVDYDDSKRQLSISQNLYAIHWLQNMNTTNILKSEYRVGEPLMDMIDTDITVNIGGENIEAYAIDGQMVIPVRALEAFGEVNFDAEKRLVRVDLIPVYYNKLINTRERKNVSVKRDFRYIAGDNDEIIYGYKENDLLMNGTKIQNIKENDAYLYGYEVLSEEQVYDAIWPAVDKEYWESEYFTDIFVKTSVNTTEIFVRSQSGNLYRFYTPTGYLSPQYSGVYRANVKSWGRGMVVANDGVLYKETDKIFAPNRWRCQFDEIVAYDVEKVSENCILYNNGDVYILEDDKSEKLASGMKDVISIEGSSGTNTILTLASDGTVYFGTKEEYINGTQKKLAVNAKNIFARGSVVDDGEVGYVDGGDSAWSVYRGSAIKLMDGIEKIISIDCGVYITSDGRLIKKQGESFDTVSENVKEAYYFNTELGLYPECLYFIKSDGTLHEFLYDKRIPDQSARRITISP